MASKQYIKLGNKMYSHVKAMDTCKLILDIEFVLDLEQTFIFQVFLKT